MNGEYQADHPTPVLIRPGMPEAIAVPSYVSVYDEEMVSTGADRLTAPTPVAAVINLSQTATSENGTAMAESPAPTRMDETRSEKYLRPWGFYESLTIGPRFQVKRIMVEPGGRLSLQKHFHRSEHWVVVEGTALVTRDGTVTLLHEADFIYIPCGCLHRLENPGRIPLTMIEVQSGPYLGEDDIVRLEDSYGRA